MGHQISFYLSQADMFVLENKFLTLDDALILHTHARGPYPRCVDSTDFVENGQRWYFFYFVRRIDLDSLIMEEVKTQGYWSIDNLRSPVIEFIRSDFDGKKIRSGRLYYNDVYYDDAGKLVGKTPGFDVWAKRVLSKARRSLTYDKELFAYLGNEAIEMCKNGVRFVQF